VPPLEQAGWNKSNFDDGPWASAAVADAPMIAGLAPTRVPSLEATPIG